MSIITFLILAALAFFIIKKCLSARDKYLAKKAAERTGQAMLAGAHKVLDEIEQAVTDDERGFDGYLDDLYAKYNQQPKKK